MSPIKCRCWRRNMSQPLKIGAEKVQSITCNNEETITKKCGLPLAFDAVGSALLEALLNHQPCSQGLSSFLPPRRDPGNEVGSIRMDARHSRQHQTGQLSIPPSEVLILSHGMDDLQLRPPRTSCIYFIHHRINFS